MGFPILLLMVAPVAGVALALNVIVENLVMLPLLLDAFERLRSSWWYSKFRFVSGFLSHSLGPAVRQSLKLKMNVLAGLMEDVFTPM